MGRKSKRKQVQKSICFYCSRLFDTEEVLIQHQKAVHFKCRVCFKRFLSLSNLTVHLKSVHMEDLINVPGAIDARKDQVQTNVVGMEGAPPWFLTEIQQNKLLEKGKGDLQISPEGMEAALVREREKLYEKPNANGLVYWDEEISPEERRAKLPRYQINVSTAALSIDERLKSIMEKRQKVQ